MTIQEIKQAVDEYKPVCFLHRHCHVYKDGDEYYAYDFSNGFSVKLDFVDTEDFFIDKPVKDVI